MATAPGGHPLLSGATRLGVHERQKLLHRCGVASAAAFMSNGTSGWRFDGGIHALSMRQDCHSSPTVSEPAGSATELVSLYCARDADQCLVWIGLYQALTLIGGFWILVSKQ